jgi:hypothetical protein
LMVSRHLFRREDVQQNTQQPACSLSVLGTSCVHVKTTCSCPHVRLAVCVHLRVSFFLSCFILQTARCGSCRRITRPPKRSLGSCGPSRSASHARCARVLCGVDQECAYVRQATCVNQLGSAWLADREPVCFQG